LLEIFEPKNFVTMLLYILNICSHQLMILKLI